MLYCKSFLTPPVLLLLLCALPPVLVDAFATPHGKNARSPLLPTGGDLAPVPVPVHTMLSTSLHVGSASASASDATSTITSKDGNSKKKTDDEPLDKYDVVVVGSGIGGLSCAAMLTLYGYSVAVFESHYRPGGCAHGYSVRSREGGEGKQKEKEGQEGSGEFYHFDTGPSFFSGLNPNLPPKLSNPLRTILDAIGEEVECIPYKTFGLELPEGSFIHTSSFGREGGVLDQVSNISQSKSSTSAGASSSAASASVLRQWDSMMEKMKPLAAAVDALPTAALRADAAVALTAASFLPNFAKATPNPLENLKLTKPFSAILDDAGIENAFARNWLDLLCFCLSGLPSDGTITAEMAMMMGEFYDPDAVMDCPRGGARAIVDPLIRGIEKRGGKIYLNSHVDKINVIDGRATGITLRSRKGGTPTVVRADKAVVSNISVWDLFGSGIIDEGARFRTASTHSIHSCLLEPKLVNFTPGETSTIPNQTLNASPGPILPLVWSV